MDKWGFRCTDNSTNMCQPTHRNMWISGAFVARIIPRICFNISEAFGVQIISVDTCQPTHGVKWITEAFGCIGNFVDRYQATHRSLWIREAFGTQVRQPTHGIL